MEIHIFNSSDAQTWNILEKSIFKLNCEKMNREHNQMWYIILFINSNIIETAKSKKRRTQKVMNSFKD